MADPERFAQYKKEIDDAQSKRELLNILAKLKKEFSIETEAKLILIALAKERIKSLAKKTNEEKAKAKSRKYRIEID